MSIVAIAVHGGASEDSIFLQQHAHQCIAGLDDALELGYSILSDNGFALTAVEAAVMSLEDNPLFNAGKGSALNCKAEIEMDASIMDGEKLQAGAVSMVRSIKNPIHLARLVMEQTNHVFLSGYGALELAKLHQVPTKPDSYFITPHQLDEYKRLNALESIQTQLKKSKKGTVGAVALDSFGNLAAATSTGGICNSLAGRIGDSCVIGGGCYANNLSCAISGTGEGEHLIRQVVAHTISMMVEQGCDLQQACDYVIKQRNTVQGEMGVIGLDTNGKFGISFNTQIMKRAWKSSTEKKQIKIY